MANLKTVLDQLITEGYLLPEKQAELAGRLAEEDAA